MATHNNALMLTAALAINALIITPQSNEQLKCYAYPATIGHECKSGGRKGRYGGAAKLTCGTLPAFTLVASET